LFFLLKHIFKNIEFFSVRLSSVNEIILETKKIFFTIKVYGKVTSY